MKIKLGNGRKADKSEAPFDRILVSAEAEGLVPSWREQIREGGRIVAPVGNAIHFFKKEKGGRITSKEHRGFAFVPLIK